MKKKNRLQMLAALLATTLSMALTSPIATKANEEYNVGQKQETAADTGRFTQEDTYLGDGRNLYAYVHSNPLKYVDPTGHTAEEIFEPGGSLVDDLQDKSCDGGNVRGNNGTNRVLWEE